MTVVGTFSSAPLLINGYRSPQFTNPLVSFGTTHHLKHTKVSQRAPLFKALSISGRISS